MNALSNAQIELLEFFKQDLDSDEMLELRRLLVAFKAERVSLMLNDLWDKNDWTNDTIQSWAKEHNRTPYKSQNDYLAKLHRLCGCVIFSRMIPISIFYVKNLFLKLRF